MVNAISNSFAVNNKDIPSIRKRTLDDGKKGFVIGAAAGAIEGFSRKSWLNNGDPSDVFIKSVSQKLEKTLDPKEQLELEKVNNFFASLIDPKTNMSDLRNRIEKSEELKNALLKNEGETTKDALDRIFSSTDKRAVKTQLKEMQNRTVVDKKVDIYAAKKLINKNFDKNNKVLKKAEETSKEMFSLLKKSVKRIKINTAIAHTAVGGILLGTFGLLVGATAADRKS